MSGFAAVSKDVTSSSLIGLFFVRRYPDMPCAADVVNALDQQALASILTAYGEERHARKLASAMVEARSVYPITRTQQLASVVAGTLINSLHCFRGSGQKRKGNIKPPSPCGTYLSGEKSRWL